MWLEALYKCYMPLPAHMPYMLALCVQILIINEKNSCASFRQGLRNMTIARKKSGKMNDVCRTEDESARKDSRYHLKAVNAETRSILDELDRTYIAPVSFSVIVTCPVWNRVIFHCVKCFELATEVAKVPLHYGDWKRNCWDTEWINFLHLSKN